MLATPPYSLSRGIEAVEFDDGSPKLSTVSSVSSAMTEEESMFSILSSGFTETRAFSGEAARPSDHKGNKKHLIRI